MAWTDSHGRPELKMHPAIKRGVASYRVETPPVKTARKRKGTAAEPTAAPEVSQPELSQKNA